MCQSVPLIIQAASMADELHEEFEQMAADGVITGAELADLDASIDQVKEISTRAELAYSWGMAVLKGGIDGKRAKELELETTRFVTRPSAA